MRKKWMSISLAIAMVLTTAPANIWEVKAAEEPKVSTVTVDYTAQMDGLLNPKLGVSVASNEAEKHGYEDELKSDQVSALDVLVKVHEDLLGGSEGNLVVDSASGFVTTVFGIPTSDFGFFVNGLYPNDGSMGTTVTQQKIENGDQVDFFLYQDSSYADWYTWFEQEGKWITETAAPVDGSLSLVMKGIPAMNGYRYLTRPEMQKHAMGVNHAQLAWVDLATGNLTSISDIFTEWDGKVTIPMPKNAGTYYLTAYTSGDGATPCIMPFIKVTAEKAEANVLDLVTPELIFSGIRGENTAMDAIDKPLVTPVGTNYISDFYAIFDEKGNFSKWSGGRKDAKAEIEFKSSSDPSILKMNEDEDQILIKKQPEKDTVVNLIFTVTEVGNSSNKKEVTIPLTVKASKKNILDLVTPELIFSGIRGENTAMDAIDKPLVTPVGTNYISDFYAIFDEKGNFSKWSGGRMNAKAEIEFKSSSDSSILKMNEDEDQIAIEKRPKKNTVVNLVFTVTEVGNSSNKKEVTLPVTVLGSKEEGGGSGNEDSAIKKELQAALDKYLTMDAVTYSTIERDGVSFAEDYADKNVRYDFLLPNVANLAGYAWNEVKTTVTSKTEEALEFPYKYTARPIRADVGGEAKEAVITYTLEKDGVSVTKELHVTIPALTRTEIQEELAVLQQVQEHFFDGLQYKNYDSDNITTDLQMFQEVYYTGTATDGYRLHWVDSAKEKHYYGFALPNNQAFEVEYPDGGEAVFASTNLVLEKRPAKDTKVVIRNTISSIQLGRYAELYPNNKELQKLNQAPVEAEVTVRAVNAGIRSVDLGGYEEKVSPDLTIISHLTGTTLKEIPVTVELENKGATLVIDGTDCKNVHKQTLSLKHGFRTFVIKVSDQDSKKEGTLQEKSITVTVASKEYLEREIEKLPEVSKADEKEIELAKQLYSQYQALSVEDQKSISGYEKLESYRELIGNPDIFYQRELEQVEKHLIEGILGENPNANTVYTDMKEIHYAAIGESDITWTKEADHSDVEILWKSSSAPEYINVHDSNDFGGRYVKAFCINQRPAAGEKDLQVIFEATIQHLKNPEIRRTVTVPIVLKAYNASLTSMKIREISDFALEAGKQDYQVTIGPEDYRLHLQLTPEIPGAKITVNGQIFDKGQEISIETKHPVSIVINDEVKNTLNGKWDEKTYTITFVVDPNKPVDPTPTPDPEKPVDPTPTPDPEKPTDPTPTPDPEKPTDPTPTPDPEKPTNPTPTPDPEKPVDPTPTPGSGKPAAPTPTPNSNKPANSTQGTTASVKPLKANTNAPHTADTNPIEGYIVLFVGATGVLLLKRKKNEI